MSLRVAVRADYPGFALDIAFEAPVPGVVALFGPSGSGKSTVLGAIAGLVAARHAAVTLDGLALHPLPPERRRIGVVFQDGRLFPHLSVAKNLRYGFTRAAAGPIGFERVTELLGLGGLLERRPTTLSGGERQRVAIGRALLSQPRLLLMDEPLSALDAARRDEILPYLGRLRSAFRIPIVYASHALDEVARLADTMVLLDRGRVLAAGPLGEVMARVDLPLAARGDASGVLQGVVAAHDAARRLTGVLCGEQIVLVPLVSAPAGTAVRLLVPAREVILALGAPQAISVNNLVHAVVTDLAEDVAGHAALVGLATCGGALLARVTLDSASRLGLRPGVAVLALIKAMSVELLA